MVDLIDDDEAILDALGLYLERKGYEVRRHSRPNEFLKSADRSGFGDCIVSDVKMPGMSGLEVQKALAKRERCPPLILITGFADVLTAVQAMKLGAYDFIEKPVDEKKLVASIRQAVTQALRDHAEIDRSASLRERVQLLSDREREVMDLAAQGNTSREIGEILGISPRTVEIHRASVMEKLGCESLADLVRFSIMLEQSDSRSRGRAR
jgi:two-component system response regulator FixJ